MPQIRQKNDLNIETLSAIVIIVFVSIFVLSNFVGFFWPIYLLAMGISIILSMMYPRSGLYATVFLTIIFERFFTLSPVYISRIEYKLYPIDFIIAAIVIGLIFQFLKKTRHERKRFELIKPDKILVGFILLNFVYFIFSIYVLRTNVLLSFSSLKNYAFYASFYFLTWMLIEKREDLKRLFGFFLSGAIFNIGFILYGILNGGGLWTQFTPLSTPGIRILAFTHGLYLSLAFVAAIAYLASKNEKNEKNYVFWLILAWFIGIIGTMMRHLWIGVFFSVLGMYFLMPEEKRMRLLRVLKRASLIFLTAGVFIFYFSAMSPYSKMSSSLGETVSAIAQRGSSIASASSDESFAWRELVWSAAWKDFKGDPIFGIGTGKTVYVEKDKYHDFVEVRNIHNSYLAVMIQLGILGFAFLATFVWKNVRKLAETIRKNKRDFFALAIFGTIIIYLVALMFQPYLETNLLALFFWMALGLSRNLSLEENL